MMGYTDFGNVTAFIIFMLMILLGAAVIWLMVWFVEKKIKQPVTSFPAPLEILKERYAKGEISKKEYAVMKIELSRE